MANKAYKFRIYPNEEQKILLAKTFGSCRFVYNYFLDRRIKLYKEEEKSMTYYDMTAELTQLKKQPEYEWLNEVPAVALNMSCKQLDTAYKNFFRDKKGFPKFKSKHTSKLSFSTQNGSGIHIKGNYVILPKVKEVKAKIDRTIPNDWKIKRATVSQNASGKYYCSLTFEYESHIQEVEPQNAIGLDFSMHELYVDSNGDCPAYPKYYRQAEKKLAREQRKLSLMQKGSNNRNKQRIKVAKLHEHISNQRRDFLHKRSRNLVNEYDCICIENLNMKSMSQSLNFGKSVTDNGWGMFTQMLKYKLADEGKHLIKIDKFFPSSQTCHNCGCVNPITKDLSVREWTCSECGHHHDRDVNAALNIRDEGVRMLSEQKSTEDSQLKLA
jgi:putative transposase